MALIKCSNCGGKISSNADSCIHCGEIIRNNGAVSYNGKSLTEKTKIIANKLNRITTLVSSVFGIVAAMSIVYIVVCFKNENYVSMLGCIVVAAITGIIAYITPLLVGYLYYVLKNMAQINETLKELSGK